MQRGVEVNFSSWTQITNVTDEAFLAKNRTGHEVLVIFSSTAPVSSNEEQNILDAWPVDVDDTFEPPDAVPAGYHCWAKVPNASTDINRRLTITMISA